ncbi:MAG: ribonuclease Y [Planctomycetaceae bacterium]|jgi:ribonuclease Y|nr:ribonuclease Y [Planctomycetaceae bacterium]
MGYQEIFITAFITALISGTAAYFGIRFWDSRLYANSIDHAKEILRRAEIDAENKIREAEIEIKTKAINTKESTEAEFRVARQELHERERLLDKRQDTLDKQAEEYRKQEKQIENNRRKLAERIVDTNRRNEDLAKLIEKERILLHEFSGLNREEATKRLLTMLNAELIEETGTIILRHEKQIKERCEAITRNIILSSMQRYAAPQTSDSTVCTVDIPNDEMKGRIIGREGRNIRAFEKATGIDIIIDDTPGVVLLSGFDPIRREIARISLDRLITDGRIHPSRIEEIVEETGKDIQSFIKKAGVEAYQEVNIFGLDERIVNLLGRLSYRTSYSQNVLRHSIEVAFLSGMIAVELGLNESLARRCGLLHDLGKAVDHEIEGGHPKIGADFLRRYGEPVEVVQAAAGHHIDLRLEDPYTIIVAVADACSASRPGARRESLENYVKRMEELETIANGFPGVEQSYAVQAGREMRVMLNSSISTDENAAKICREIVKALTEQIQFPGEIKVTVIRETRFVEIAK